MLFCSEVLQYGQGRLLYNEMKLIRSRTRPPCWALVRSLLVPSWSICLSLCLTVYFAVRGTLKSCQRAARCDSTLWLACTICREAVFFQRGDFAPFFKLIEWSNFSVLWWVESFCALYDRDTMRWLWNGCIMDHDPKSISTLPPQGTRSVGVWTIWHRIIVTVRSSGLTADNL